jgi:hypothetical protein
LAQGRRRRDRTTLKGASWASGAPGTSSGVSVLDAVVLGGGRKRSIPQPPTGACAAVWAPQGRAGRGVRAPISRKSLSPPASVRSSPCSKGRSLIG